MLVALSVLWGGSFFFNGVAVRELPTLTVVLCRVGLAAITMLIVIPLVGMKMPRGGRVWAAFFGMGLLNNVVPFSLFVWGQSHIASGVASILNATTPLFTVVVADRLTRDEKMTGGRLAGVVIGLAGVTTMIGAEALASLGVQVAAQVACLAGALSFALAGVFGRRFHQMGVSPMATAAGQVAASSAMLLPLTLALDRPWTLPMPSLTTLAALITLAVVSTAFAYVLYFRLLASAGATNLLLVTFLIPVSAILLGVVFLDETFLVRHGVGMGMIGIGLAAIDGRLWAAWKSARN